MSLVAVLEREHRLLDGLLGRLERAFQYGDDAARGEILGALLILLPALDRHERIEDAVFSAERARPARAALERVGAQHARIEGLADRLRELLGAAEPCPLPPLKAAVESFAAALRGHFRTEEDALWPFWKAPVSKSAERRAQRQVAALERQVADWRAQVAAYVGGAP